jgi:FkbM family methyltransferase
MLWRAFRGLGSGFYIDVGANDPVVLSTTKAFYDAGWSGINMEPCRPYYRALTAQRPRDINLHCAVGDHDGVIRLYEIPETGLSTTEASVAEKHRGAARSVSAVEVPLRRLQTILVEHPVQDVHFLKVDVEGAEEAVLRGADFASFRPWVIVVESTAPLSSTRSDDSIRALLEDAGYIFAHFDGINGFFVASERADLLPHFNRPVNPLDGHVLHSDVVKDGRIMALENSQRQLEEKIRQLESWNNDLRGDVEQMKSSSSWRLTWPVRAAKGLIQGFLGRSAPPAELPSQEPVAAPPVEDPVELRERLSRQPLLEFTKPDPGETPVPEWDGLDFPGRSGTPTQRLSSGLCTRAQLESPAFRYWLERMNLGFRLHRKEWEFAFILQALYERSCLRPGARGLGFAVGEESLPALFASFGCEVVATDLNPGDSRAQAWAETAQLATSLDKLRRPEICPDAEFDRLVSYRHVDMNHIPADLRDFDFTWSSCSFEHCGSIELGLQFVDNQMACLRPGGFAIHTTEFNLSSNDETLEVGVDVIFRRRDIDCLVEALASAGHLVEPVSYIIGRSGDDQTVDIFPYTRLPHLKLLLADRYVSTSIALIIRKAG